MEKQTPQALLDKYLSGNANAEEKAIVESWYLKHASRHTDDLAEPNYSDLDKEMWPVIDAQTPERRKSLRLWPLVGSVAAAAAIVLVVWLYYTPDQAIINRNAEVPTRQDIPPGKNTATLTLPDGKILDLSDTKTGVVVDASKLRYNDGEELAMYSGGIEPLKGSSGIPQFLADGQRWDRMAGSWRGEGFSPLSEMGGNFTGIDERKAMRVSTPRGGTYQIILPDGSKVWLNAASSIKFPASFNDAKQRIVELTGEAYFAVRKSPDIPFVVRSRGQETLVLGTEFNVNSYFDEDEVVTTLVQGSLKVSSANGKSVLLVPGEESLSGRLDLKKREADLALATSWREGTFYFNKTPFSFMLRQVSRWYNVDVVYLTKEIPNIRFTGEIKRDVTLQTVLTYLQNLGVKLRVKDRTLFIE